MVAWQETPDGSRPPRPEPRGEAEFARIRAPGGESAGGTMVAVVYADRSVRPSLPPPPDGWAYLCPILQELDPEATAFSFLRRAPSHISIYPHPHHPSPP